jgi:hypothetical protein
MDDPTKLRIHEIVTCGFNRVDVGNFSQTQLDEVRNIIGHGAVPAGWRDGTAAAPNNLYAMCLELQQRIAALEPS